MPAAMGIYEEAATQLANAIAAWDFSALFPSGYAGIKGVLITPAFPYDTIDNMMKATRPTPAGCMSQPIISIVEAHGTGSFRALGGNYFDPNQPTVKLKAERMGQAFLISSWADELLGGHVMARKLGGLVAGCVLANRTTLPSFRQLRISSTDAAYEDKPRLWVFDQHVEGVAVQTVTLP